MKTLSVKIPESLEKWLSGEAKRKKRSRSDLVREALERSRSGEGTEKQTTLAEAMADLKGTITGPPDLSTNPSHFADFGK
jgi:Arc/MetJ-type ribon-helix-helix transcriptional regulator